MYNTTITDIVSRRSIRKFTDRPIEDNLLEQVLIAGSYAPTSKGKQSPVIVAISNKLIREQLTVLNKQFCKKTGIDPYYNPPTIILVFAPNQDENPNSVYDGSLVLGNMQIAAHSLGLGTCWIHREREMFSTKEGKQIMTQLQIPTNYIGIGALSIGYPDQEPKAAPRKKDYYKIIK